MPSATPERAPSPPLRPVVDSPGARMGARRPTRTRTPPSWEGVFPLGVVRFHVTVDVEREESVFDSGVFRFILPEDVEIFLTFATDS